MTLQRTLGTCYYPEHWPEKIWAEDAARMAVLGLTWVRIGEFAWSRLEPSPGDLQFDWLDRAIDVLHAAGLKVVLGTPTATPPRWMVARHPDMLAVDDQGRPRKFGSRRHYCFSHDGYREEGVRITGLLAERFGRKVDAWQTDNEYGCHDTVYSYSDAAQTAFREWLAQKYQSPDALNRAWGNVFWSMDYDSFDDIDLPNLSVAEPNPSHALDFRRFSSDQVARFNGAQVAAIRAHSDVPISHNYMGRIVEFDHFATGRQMEIATWDSYPLGFLEDRLESSPEHKRRYARQGDPDFQAFHHDLYRAVGQNGRWWVMEQQPGPVNWAPHNPAPLPGMVRFWTWEAFAHGAECIAYFRWRQAPFAQEQYHAGLLRPDNVEAEGFAEAAQVARELQDMPAVEHTQAPVALVFDYASAWGWSVQPQGAGCDYFRLVFEVYRGLRKLGLSVDILPPDAKTLNGYALVLAPGVLTLSDALKAALSETTAQVLLGPHTNAKTPALGIPVPLPPAISGLSAIVARVETLRNDMPIPAENGGSVKLWFEHLETTHDAVEKTEAGAPILVQSANLSYLAGWPDEMLLERVLTRASSAAGLSPEPLPQDIRIRDTGTTRFVFNHGPDAVAYNGQSIPPAGVTWD
ncbi:beta-galactosidase [Jannaschia sp. CCS1]|uniref:beta-galactosidase n=1 Tax=Jannaschia sp. (strain CCS1) TaxID=290400 RepID=UPI000053ABC9|nr:beta-galactosidase [Jannaschia sp. CCS1]ABD56747.1 Beta-galactosidase [Jannaschia sp. CCS1]